jgi:hypothetical protein
MKKTDFEKYQEEFARSKNGKAALLFLIDSIDGKFGGDAPEELAQDTLNWRVIKSCYNAKRYENISQKKRSREHEFEQDTFQEIRGKGKSQIKAITELRKFIKNYPGASNYAMDVAVQNLYLSSLRIEIKREDEEFVTWEQVLDLILAEYEVGLRQYIPSRDLAYWFHDGCLLFPEPIEKKRSDSALDGLIFELAFYTKRYISSNPTRVLEPGMPLPRSKRLAAQNEIIAKFVNATLFKSIDGKGVKQRLDYLVKKKAKLAPWDFAVPQKRKI